eukprot:146965-Pelagomonas_calceolata.AAC.1
MPNRHCPSSPQYAPVHGTAIVRASTPPLTHSSVCHPFSARPLRRTHAGMLRAKLLCRVFCPACTPCVALLSRTACFTACTPYVALPCRVP